MNVAINVMGLQTGDLILCTGQTTTSKAIQFGQGVLHGTVSAPYSHAAIVLAPGYILEAVYDKGVSVNCLFDGKTLPEQHGVEVIMPFRPWQRGYTKFHVYRHPDLAAIDDDEKRRFIHIALRYYGEDYATKFHFLNLLHHRMQDAFEVRKFLKARSASRRDRLSIGESFCSELAAKVYREFGLSIPQKHMPSPIALKHENWAFERVRHMEIADTDVHPVTGVNESLLAWSVFRTAVIGASHRIKVYQAVEDIDRLIIELTDRANMALEQNNMNPLGEIEEVYRARARQLAEDVEGVEGKFTLLFTGIERELEKIVREQATPASLTFNPDLS